MEKIKESELIINPDGSVYHLNVKPEDIANDIIFVGDQFRVEAITKYFDSIEFSTQKREFKTETGTYKGKKISVISTGIGPDNIDIVINELDALVNVDFATRTIKPNLTKLNIIRVGTSGSLQADIPVDSILMSTHGVGTDNMLRSYDLKGITETEMEDAFISQTNWDLTKGRPYIVEASKELIEKFASEKMHQGITITAGGFYGAQGRVIRIPVQDPSLNSKIDAFKFNNLRATNLEMETGAIYGLSKLLSHHSLSLNAIIANRANGTFSTDPYAIVEKLIQYTLDKITQ